MKNFWLEKKQARTNGTDKSYIQIKSSYGSHLELVDLSGQIQHNSRYKEYARLEDSWERSLEPFDFESKEKHRGINLLTRSGHYFEMNDESTYPEIYGFKTPEKHTTSYTNEEDPPKITNRWKRVEIMSNMGTFIIMKDDTYCGKWNLKEENGRSITDQSIDESA